MGQSRTARSRFDGVRAGRGEIERRAPWLQRELETGMHDLLFFAGFWLVWLALQRWVLPRLGVGT